MPMTKIDNEHDKLVTMLNQLMDERETLCRENEYLKAKLNESMLMETINEMKKERDLLFKLLSNLTINNNNKDYVKRPIKENNTDLLSSPSYPTINGKTFDYNNNNNSTLLRHKPSSNRSHRLRTSIEQSQPTAIFRVQGTKENLMNNSHELLTPFTQFKHSQPSKKIFVYKTSTIPQTQEFNKLIRKHDGQLKHSQNSPFQHYRSQSLQDLT